MKKIIYLILFFLLFSMAGCPESTMDIDVCLINNSEEDIVFCFSIGQEDPCPSISLPAEQINNIVKANQRSSAGFIGIPLVCDSIKIFVLSADTVNTYPWEQIRAENNILKRYDLTYKTLEKNNWTITFP